MHMFRKAIWLMLAIILASFVWMNWHMAEVNLWPLENGFLHVDWPIGLVALAFFLAGFLPAWMVGKARRWRLLRRIATLENTLRANTPTMIGTSTQFDALNGHKP
jgi:putative membrane protein